MSKQDFDAAWEVLRKKLGLGIRVAPLSEREFNERKQLLRRQFEEIRKKKLA